MPQIPQPRIVALPRQCPQRQRADRRGLAGLRESSRRAWPSADRCSSPRAAGPRPTTSRSRAWRFPLHKNVAWKSEYRYYGYGEMFYQYEGFRAHILQTGLTLSR